MPDSQAPETEKVGSTEDAPPQAGADPSHRRRKVPIRTKLAFSSGALQEGMVIAAGITTLLFYNQVHGVSASLCGVAFLIASVVDAVSDPLVGALSDRYQSRWGRRHPFMLLSALPLAISFYFLYQPIPGLGETGLFVWLVSFLVLLRLATTFYNIPHDALGAELTDDYHERTSVFGYNSVIVSGTSVVLSLFVLIVLFPSTPDFSNGLLDPSRYGIMAAIGAVVVLVGVLTCTFGTADQIPYLHSTPRQRPGVRDYYRDLLQLLANPSYISVSASWLTIAVAMGVLNVVSTFTYVYAYELSTEAMSILGFSKLPGILVALPLAIYITRRLDKKPTAIITSLVSGILVAFPHILRLMGLFPGNDSPLLLPLLLGPLFLGYALVAVVAIVVDSQLVDVADDHEYKTGRRAEGVVFSVRTFAMKATTGVGGLIGGFGLDLIQFPENAEVGEVASGPLNGLLIMSGPLYLLIYVVGVLFMAMYRLNEDRHQEILSSLEERRAAKRPRIDDMSLEQMKRDFDRDGYVVLRGFLSPAELEELRAHTERCLSKVKRKEEYEGIAKNLNKVDRWFEDQLERGKQTELISALLEDDLEPATAAWFDRIPGENTGVKPHFDAVGHRREGATLWIALDRADRENGCLYYAKGTHRQKLPNHLGLQGFSAESEEAIAVEAEPGDAVIHSSLTVHWSEANRSQRSRQAISYFYWTASSQSEPEEEKVVGE